MVAEKLAQQCGTVAPPAAYKLPFKHTSLLQPIPFAATVTRRPPAIAGSSRNGHCAAPSHGSRAGPAFGARRWLGGLPSQGPIAAIPLIGALAPWICLTAAAALGLAIAGASHVGSIALAMRRTARRSRRLGPRPPAGVSILRPVCGLEHRIEETLASSFRIDHPSYEVIFCVAAADDPVVPLVQRLIRENPAHSGPAARRRRAPRGPNPKLDNLIKAWDVARHDWIVLADSNVLIPPDYLDRLFARWTERCAFVCSPAVGIDAQGCAAELEAAFINTFQVRWQLAVDEARLGLCRKARRCFCGAGSSPVRVGSPRSRARSPRTPRRPRSRAAGAAGSRHRSSHLRSRSGSAASPASGGRQMRWARLRRLSFPGFFCAELPAGGVFPCILAELARERGRPARRASRP